MTTDTSRIDTSPKAIDEILKRPVPDSERDPIAYLTWANRMLLDMRHALRALAAEKRAAEDGLTEDVIDRASEAFDDVYECELELGATHWTDNKKQALRHALQSAALALQSKDAQRSLEDDTAPYCINCGRRRHSCNLC